MAKEDIERQWTVLDRSSALDNRWFPVERQRVRLPNGKELDDYYVWNSGDVAMVVPITKDGKIVLVKQYKHGTGQMMIECPAGYLGKESPEEAARRETMEETGYRVGDLVTLGVVIHHPTKETGKLHVFLARVSNRPATNQTLDGNEDIEVLTVPVQEVLAMIHDGRIWATATIASIYMVLSNLKVLQVDLEKL